MVKEIKKVSEIEVIYRPAFKETERPQIKSSVEAYEIFIEHWNKERIEFNEEFKVMLLNRELRVLGIATISVGGMDATVVDAKIIFAIALKAKASSIILAHNHSSGNLNPSEADRQITDRLLQVGKLLDLPINDHLIITNDGYTSFEDIGMM